MAAPVAAAAAPLSASVVAPVASKSMWPYMVGQAGARIGEGILGFIGIRRQNRHQIQLAREGMAHDLRMWQMQADYNHPIQQMQRLRAAGLNPALMYGQGVVGATGQMASHPRAIVPQIHAEETRLQIPGALDLLNSMEVAYNIILEGNRRHLSMAAIQYNMDKTMAETDLKRIEYAKKIGILDYEIKRIEYESMTAKNEEEKSYWQARGAAAETQLQEYLKTLGLHGADDTIIRVVVQMARQIIEEIQGLEGNEIQEKIRRER